MIDAAGVITIPPHFTVVPAGHASATSGMTIALGAGRAFGDGRHDTTVLSLQAVGALAPRHGGAWSMLDFGSGTGILSIGAALLGANALGVEIDEHALLDATANAALNGVSDRVDFTRTLPPPPASFDLVVGNILRSILLDAAASLARCVSPAGTLVLCGLTSTDVPEVSARYTSALHSSRPTVHSRGDWRALVWRLAA